MPRGSIRIGTFAAIVVGLAAMPRLATATTYIGTPSNYRTQLGQLAPGDTLLLSAGTYVRMTLDGINGSPGSWITIMGPSSGPAAIIEGEPGYNTVQLYGCSYLAIKRLTIDGKNLDVDGINSKDQVSHDILIEGCTLVGFGNNQQTVGISTKETVWNWTIRGNRITEAGTGIYLGSSVGDSPFIAGIIEGNLIENPTGYCMQVKFQLPYSYQTGMPAGPNRTIIRNNVFIKDSRPSPDGNRPNLLVDDFPSSGPGSGDHYEIYGNFFFNNPREALFQASGRVSIHDNVFVGAGAGEASLLLVSHDGAFRAANVYNNTIYGSGGGISVATAPAERASIVGNLVFSPQPIGVCGGCSNVTVTGNLTDAVSNAGQYVNSPSLTLGSMDFYPRASCAGCEGTPLDLSPFASDADYALDFNGTSKGSFRYRGAYAGSGTNPGWQLTNSFKVGGPGGNPGPTDTTPPSPPIGLRAE